MITVKDYKADFPLLMQDPTIYIDNAATTPGAFLTLSVSFTKSTTPIR